MALSRAAAKAARQAAQSRGLQGNRAMDGSLIPEAKIATPKADVPMRPDSIKTNQEWRDSVKNVSDDALEQKWETINEQIDTLQDRLDDIVINEKEGRYFTDEELGSQKLAERQEIFNEMSDLENTRAMIAGELNRRNPEMDFDNAEGTYQQAIADRYSSVDEAIKIADENYPRSSFIKRQDT